VPPMLLESISYDQKHNCHGRGRGFEPRRPRHKTSTKQKVYGTRLNQAVFAKVLNAPSSYPSNIIFTIRSKIEVGKLPQRRGVPDSALTLYEYFWLRDAISSSSSPGTFHLRPLKQRLAFS
jgi:hypothetical protein